MKSFAIVALSTLALASQATAQLLSFSEPIGATQWTAGQSATVSWTNTCDDVSGNTTFPITLNYQVGTLQVQVPNTTAIGTLDCSQAGSTQVQVPATVPQGSTYSILVVDGGNQSYSAQFTIMSTVPPLSVSASLPTATTAAATTSALPTAATTTGLPTVTTPTATPKATNAAMGVLKAGSTAALVVVAAVASLLL
ncbi:hypothetical protein EMPS_04851 [Entomortierella parvispora]|uniref:Yeast cell wall synthesis Kre9/Knh1-like N-terminal domain-containing protein n=1 Tax=Entomortierella parvispora TaxID=205924 RepID=A0A9P3H9T0_9FUNG|nr:hypothetical protein EMPS_04851 [Entomortierella parvispora]